MTPPEPTSPETSPSPVPAAQKRAVILNAAKNPRLLTKAPQCPDPLAPQPESEHNADATHAPASSTSQPRNLSSRPKSKHSADAAEEPAFPPPPLPRADPATYPPSPGPALRALTYLVFDPLIALVTILFGCASLLTSLWDRSGRQQHAIARAWASTLLHITFSPVTVLGTDRLPPGPAVFASNHLSYMDTPVLFAHLPFQFRILAKQSLWKIPFIGWHLHRSGQVPVDQSTARTSIASLSRGAAALKAGMPLVLFPEGGRAATGQTGPFLSGAAFMAIRAQVPLVPLTLVGTWQLLPIHTYTLRPRPLLLLIGDPLPTTGLSTRDAESLTQQAFHVITRTYLDHTALHP